MRSSCLRSTSPPLPTAAALFALLLSLALPGLAQWPEWRGPDGAGVSTETAPLPERWEPGSDNIRWSTPIPGDGISSPIVSDGRVFVTTAYKGSRSQMVTLLVRLATVVVALGLLLLLFGQRRAKDAADARPRHSDRGHRVVVGVSLLFLLLVLVISLKPDLLIPAGNPGRAWRVGGATGLLGLTAAFGWFARRSSARLVGIALTAIGAVLLLLWMPTGAYGLARLSKGLPLVAPAAALSIWYLLAFVRDRKAAAPAGRSQPLAALCLVLLAVLAFAAPNYLNGLLRVVVCLDVDSGEILWETPVFSSPPEQKWPHSSYATPTPATDGERVYAYFGHGVAAVSLDGEVEWVERFPGYAQNTRYGAGASPVVAGDAVVVVREKEENQDGPESWIAALDRKSGKTLWRIEPPGAHDSYTTPMVVRQPSGTQLLTPSWNVLVAYDAASGERLWSLDYPMEQMVSSLARSGDLVAVTGGAYGERALMMLRITGNGAELVWRENRRVATISSPVLYAGQLFTLTTPGILSAFDAETGAELWKQRLEGEHYASLVAGDGKIYAVGVDGATSVIAAEPEFRMLSRSPLDGAVYSSPAIAHGCLLIRTAESLVCIAA